MNRNSLQVAREVIAIESAAIAALADRLDSSFEKAVETILSCSGRVVVTGIGKSGAIGRKIASTLASTGTAAQFLHAAEALHGDLGVVTSGDVLIAISYSGRADELLTIVPKVHELGVPVIAFSGNPDSFLATHAEIFLNIRVEQEACSLNLAPTASTTATLVMGDALALAVMEMRGFALEDYARTHPAGQLGRGLKLRVGELMRVGGRVATVVDTGSVRAALAAITSAQAGAVMVIDPAGRLAGYFTDGDLRRHLLRAHDPSALMETPVSQLMTRTPLTFRPEMTAIEALRLLQARRVDDAPVVDDENRPVGWLDEHDLVRAGLS